MDLAAWVHAARTHAKMTMQELGDALHRTKGAVFHWESGTVQPSFEQVVKISELTGYPLPGAPKSADALTGTEGVLVGLFRVLDAKDREAIITEVRERAAHYGPRQSQSQSQKDH